MEFIIGFGLVAVLMLCLGFDLMDVGMLVVWLMGAAIVLTALFFTAMVLFLAFTKPVTAEFLRIDSESRFPCAVYKVGDEEFRNVFPGEMVMKKKLYAEGKKKKMLKSRVFRVVIDGNALLTIILGAGVFIPGAYATIVFFINLVAGNAA